MAGLLSNTAPTKDKMLGMNMSAMVTVPKAQSGWPQLLYNDCGGQPLITPQLPAH